MSPRVYYDPGSTREEMTEWIGGGLALYPQTCNDLGERLQQAFQQVFNEGAQRAIVIGTDVPGLNVAVVEEAERRLRTYDVVLGPSPDGGYYLLGMNTPAWDLFTGIPWSTPDVLSESVRRIKALWLSCDFLLPLRDVDTAEDYSALLGGSRWSHG